MTFAAASQKYIEWRGPSKHDLAWIERLVQQIGEVFVEDINQAALVSVANNIYGAGHEAIKNRSIMTPAGYVLHYAAKNKWCEWLRVEKFKEPAAKTRYVNKEVERTMHMGCRLKGTRWRVNKRLLLLWLFRQGDRISDALRVKYEDCDTVRMEVVRHVSKSDRHTVLPLDETIGRYLRRVGGKGYIFKWRDHHSADRWIKRLADRMGVKFTPHMARHTVGKRLNDGGAGLKTIMQKLGQKDPKSAIRYQTTDVEIIRKASEVLK